MVALASPPVQTGTRTSGKSIEQVLLSFNHSLLSVRALVKLGVKPLGTDVTFIAAAIAVVIGSCTVAGAFTQTSFLLLTCQAYFVFEMVVTAPVFEQAPPALSAAKAIVG